MWHIVACGNMSHLLVRPESPPDFAFTKKTGTGGKGSAEEGTPIGVTIRPNTYKCADKCLVSPVRERGYPRAPTFILIILPDYSPV
jgi:hypothetical protein